MCPTTNKDRTGFSQTSVIRYAPVLILMLLLHAFMTHGDVGSAEAWFHQTKSKQPPLYNAMMKGMIITIIVHQICYVRHLFRLYEK